VDGLTTRPSVSSQSPDPGSGGEAGRRLERAECNCGRTGENHRTNWRAGRHGHADMRPISGRWGFVCRHLSRAVPSEATCPLNSLYAKYFPIPFFQQMNFEDVEERDGAHSVLS
jgi:hypothetical protein